MVVGETPLNRNACPTYYMYNVGEDIVWTSKENLEQLE